MLSTGLSACANTDQSNADQPDIEQPSDAEAETTGKRGEAYTENTSIEDVIHDTVFGDYGRLIFPADSWYYSGNTLGELGLTWYSHIDPDKTVEIVNYMKEHVEAGDIIFYENLPHAMRAVALLMWERCTTAFPMRWNYPKKVITLLR